ncbi:MULTISPECIES: FecCD family ABC transporter permease [Bacillus]|uniref:Iron ABC transporter permease n=1 Tax=Bacillus pumilus (strain SAFR-032) TaxID=315750 RepID=A8FHC8_BACP2|nr:MULTISPECIES: iron ABC transporter permease [Bacillus]ABV63645.1 iron ABC transporter permease [Bacillus pumilus SAFR-032]MBC3641575.1 iron ABC transporter permease [Bacillus pumilus]MBC3646245.1 iron ABC transporter permease [Bacillus pumilus]MBC3650251.1 iron ABC transporter permease [Bacillus pumilus]MBC3652063.1 iron ABC transporter permease [Bacillus pumilus]
MEMVQQAKIKKYKRTMLMIFLAIVVVFLISLNTGEIRISPIDTLKTFFGFGSEMDELVLFEFRLPRMIIALLVGASIAVSGAIWQGVSQNGLADPGILGVNAGAGFAVVLFIFVFQGTMSNLGQLTIFILPLFAFAGAAFAAFLIYVLAWKKGITPVRLILTGIGVNAAFSAAIVVIQLKMSPNDFNQAIVWLSGSIWGSSWTYVLSVLPWMLIFLVLALVRARYLNIMNLGDQLSYGLGISVHKERSFMMLIAVALAGASVAVAGSISFLGLAAPHLARKLVGPKHQGMIPASALIGALLLLLADTLGRVILAPSEVPVGLVVSALGAPYFIYLLMKTN